MASKKKKSEVEEESSEDVEEKAEQRETPIIYSKEDCFDGNASTFFFYGKTLFFSFFF